MDSSDTFNSPQYNSYNFQSSTRARQIRLKIHTNRSINFVTSIRSHCTVSDLANRALNVYLELNNSRDNANYKQLTVASVTQGIYHLPKSEVVCNLLNWDDDVEVEIVKAKPKYPRNIGEVKVQEKPFIIKQPQQKDEEYLCQHKIPTPDQQHSIANQILEEDQNVQNQMNANISGVMDNVVDQCVKDQENSQFALQEGNSRVKMKKKKKKNIIISADPWPIKKVKINETKQAEKEETANHSKIDVNRNSKSDEKQPKKTPQKSYMKSPKITFHNMQPESPKIEIMGSPATSVKGLHGSETKDKDSLLGFMLQTGEVVPSRIVNEKPHPLERKEWKDKKNKTATETLGQKQELKKNDNKTISPQSLRKQKISEEVTVQNQQPVQQHPQQMLRAKQPIIVEEDSDSGSDSPAHVNKNSMQPNSKYNEINQMMGRYQIESQSSESEQE